MNSINNNILPNALMMGVEYDLFWTLNPKSLEPFIEAFSMRQKYDDVCAWRNGMYIRLAVASLLDKSVDYPREPMGMDTLDLTPDEKAVDMRNKLINQMVVINSRFKEDVRN